MLLYMCRCMPIYTKEFVDRRHEHTFSQDEPLINTDSTRILYDQRCPRNQIVPKDSMILMTHAVPDFPL